MTLSDFTEDVAIIGKLSTFPNADDGLTDEELKAKFDEAPSAIKKYLNEQVVPAVRGLQKKSGTLRVTITENPWAADKTFTEIYAAYEAGQSVECVLSNGEILALVGANPEAVVCQSANQTYYSRIVITADDVVKYSSGDYSNGNGNGGSDGGYYTPAVTDNGDGTMEVSFIPSTADMPAVDPQTIALPEGRGVSGVRVENSDSQYVIHFDYTDGGTATFGMPKAADGYTPVKGVDYWTDEDKAEMVADVLAALPVYNGEVAEV